MKVRSFTTRLIQLNASLLYFPPDCPGQLVTSLPDDDIKEILYHTMQYMGEKKMIEQGYNYFYGPIHSMAEFFNTRIENLDKSIPPSVPSRNRKKSKKVSNKRNGVVVPWFQRWRLRGGTKGKKFCQYHGTCGHTTDECTKLKSTSQAGKTEERKTLLDKEKDSPSMRLRLWFRSKLKTLWNRKKEHTEELHTFKKVSVSDSDQVSINFSSSEAGEI